MKRMQWLIAWGMMLLVSESGGQTVSVFDTVYTPPGNVDGIWPATMFVPAVGNGIGVVLVHGSSGIRQHNRCWCDTLAAYGYVAMSIEYPETFLYPKPARALKLAVQFLRRNAARFGITTNKIVGWGMSLGAITWGEAIIWDNDYRYFDTDSTVDDHLNAAILLYGFYEYDFTFPGVRAYFSNDSSKFVKGTCVKHIANITTPILLLHGTGDNVVPYQGSVQLHDSLVNRGKVSELVPFPGLGHVFDVVIPGGTFTAPGLVAKDTALAFLRRTVAPALKIRVSSSSINFGNLLVGTSDTVTLRVDNIGGTPLNLQSMSKSRPEFTLLNLPSLPQAIPPGGSLQFGASFRSVAQGTVNDTVSLASDDPLHPVVKISLRGNGIATIASAKAGVLYTTSAGPPEGYLLSMSTLDGAMDTIGPLGASEIRSMTIRRSDRIIYGTSLTSSRTGLYRISPTSGEAALFVRIPVGNVSALAFSPGDTLYAVTTKGTLYRVDLVSGHADSLGTSPGLVYTGLSFRPRSGELWASVRTPIDSIFKLSRLNGAPTLVGTTGFNALTSSIAFSPSGVLYALIDNGYGEDYLATIDTVTAAGTIIAGPLSVGNLRAITMRTDTLVSAVQDRQAAEPPLAFALEQNYPNPFNPTTSIGYQISNPGRVTLKVFDVLGREIATPVSEVKQPGRYTVQLDGSYLASGVYFYRLSAGDFIQTKKLLLAK